MSKLNHQKAIADRFLNSVTLAVTLTTGVVGGAIAPNAANAETPSNSNTESQLIRSASTNSLLSPTVSQNVTSVSQLSDVRPTDWAFTALQSLVERYGVIAGYPDQTYRGNQPLSRYEFAAGLNSALDKINEIISAGLADKVSKEDLETLQRLQEEFASELTALRGRVDALDAKTAKLEAQQFSTTTKLRGEAIFSLAAASDGVGAGTDRTNTIFSYRARLNLDTSFTGKDLLRTRLQASNTQNLIAPALLGTPAAGASTRLSYDTGGTANVFDINRLWYRFPVGEAIAAYVAPIGQLEDVIDPLNPLTNDGQGTISRFGRLNPLLRIGNGTPAGGSLAVLGFDWKLSPQANLQFAYSANDAASASNPDSSGGLFGGSTVAAAQLVYKPTDAFKLGIGYANSYHQGATLNSGLNQETFTSTVAVPSLRANTIVGSLVWDITNKFTFNTWGSYIFADGNNNAGSTTFTSWSTGFSFEDVFGEGDLAAVIFGQPLYKIGAGGNAIKTNSPDVPYHLEALYRFRVSKNISITPGVYFVFNPNSNSANGTATVGVIRTTFTF